VRCDLIPIVRIVAQGSCSVHCAGTNRAYSASMGGIVVNSSSYACYRRWRGDLTPVVPDLSGWADARTWVTSQGVSSVPMGERHQRSVSGEAETNNADSGARARRWCHRGLACVRDLGLRPRVNRRCSETPLNEASDEAGRWAGLLTCLAGGPARESLARLPFVDLSP
jgi:hypothetical protein